MIAKIPTHTIVGPKVGQVQTSAHPLWLKSQLVETMTNSNFNLDSPFNTLIKRHWDIGKARLLQYAGNDPNTHKKLSVWKVRIRQHKTWATHDSKFSLWRLLRTMNSNINLNSHTPFIFIWRHWNTCWAAGTGGWNRVLWHKHKQSWWDKWKMSSQLVPPWPLMYDSKVSFAEI